MNEPDAFVPPHKDEGEHFGGPFDGQVGRLGDGVVMVRPDGYYRVEWMHGRRLFVWHQRPERQRIA